MLTSVRPFVTAGIALVGASMIATQAPIAPPEASIPQIPHVAYQSVQLAAAPSPIEFYAEVATHALRNSVEVASIYLGHPISAAVGVAALVIAPPSWPVTATIAASAVLNGVGATLVAIGDVVEAVLSLNLVDLVNAIIDIPARIVDGVLNGGYPMGTEMDAGLLTADSPLGERFPGLFVWPAMVGYLITGGLFGLSAAAPEEVTADTDASVAVDAEEASVVSEDGMSDESPVDTDTEQTPADVPAEVPAVEETAVVTEEPDEESVEISDDAIGDDDAAPDNKIQAEIQVGSTEESDVQPGVQDSEVQDSDTKDSDNVEAGASQAAVG